MSSEVRSASQIWKIQIEVEMEEILRLLKVKLPSFALSPTLFRRRFRSLYVSAFNALNHASKSPTKREAGDSTLDSPLNELDLLWIHIQNNRDKIRFTSQHLAASKLTVARLTSSKAPSELELGEVSEVAVRKLNSWATGMASLMHDMLSRNWLSEQNTSSNDDIYRHAATVESIIHIICAIENQIQPEISNNTSEFDLVPQCSTLARAAVLAEVTAVLCGQQMPLIKGGKINVADDCPASSVRNSVQWIERENIIFVALAQSILGINYTNAVAVVKECYEQRISVVLFFVFAFIFSSKLTDNDSVLSDGMTSMSLVTWLADIFEYPNNGISQEDKPTDESSAVGFEGFPTFNSSVEDDILKHFFDAFSGDGI